MGEQLDDYIFPSADFEDPSFNPAAFVAKYRRVSSLESLRTQLQAYSEALKQQLFVIINRDYKDFIGIATKLDGVDTRVEVLRRPLVDLRLDLSSLHDWLMTSLQALDSKMSKKVAIRSRREKIESAIKCLDKLDVAERIIEGNVWKEEELQGNGERDDSTLKRRELSKALGKLRAYHMTSPTSSYGPFQGSASHQKDIFEASELERAAYALASARSHLGVLHSPRSEEMAEKYNNNKEGPASGGRKGSIANESDYGDSGEPDSSAITTSNKDNAVSQTNTILLEQRFNRLTEQLLGKIRGWFEESLASGDSSGVNNNINTKEDLVVRELGNRRLLQHCLCALQVMGRLDIAQAAVAECVLPYAKGTLTQGRVDGGGGRGSFGGLKAALLTVLQKLDQPVLTLLATAEGMGCDLVIGGVWSPITTLVCERFPNVFRVGIASVLADCFRAFEAFHAALSTQLLGPEYTTALTRRLTTDSRVVAFRDRWNLDLYLKLRTQEVSLDLIVLVCMCHQRASGRLIRGSIQPSCTTSIY